MPNENNAAVTNAFLDWSEGFGIHQNYTDDHYVQQTSDLESGDNYLAIYTPRIALQIERTDVDGVTMDVTLWQPEPAYDLFI